MIINYANKKQIITHESGIVSEYTAEQKQAQIENNSQQIADLQAINEQLQAEIQLILAS
jgi:hypothetical protein